jgi:hypothetical protein
MNPLYELVPISEKPEKDGRYFVLNADSLQVSLTMGAGQYDSGQWWNSPRHTHWLRPIDPETLKAMIREEFGKAWESGGLANKEVFINSVINNLFKQ